MFVEYGLRQMVEGKRGKLNTYYLALFKTNTPITISTVIGDLTEADYDGYARQAITNFGAAYQASPGVEETDDLVHSFTPTGSVTPNTIYGWFIVDSAVSGVLIAGDLLPESFLLNSPSKTLSLTPKVTDRNH